MHVIILLTFRHLGKKEDEEINLHNQPIVIGISQIKIYHSKGNLTQQIGEIAELTK